MADEIKQDEIDQLLEGNQQGAPEQEEATAGQGDQAASETSSEEDLLAQWEEALQEAKEAEEKKEPSKSGATAPEARAPQLEEFAASRGSDDSHPSLDFILDIPLEISVEIGRSKMIINDLLKLSQGSIIELNKMAGEPAEIYVNQRLMARGEVVVVNDRFAVRLTEIISPQERVRQLGS